jgi:hypothetical protein
MTTVKNLARGPRVVNVRTGKDSVEQITLRAGETREDVEIANDDDPVLQGMIDAGELAVGDVRDAAQRRKEAMEDPARFANDSFQVERREIATAAGHTEGLADAFPEGAEVQMPDDRATPAAGSVHESTGHARDEESAANKKKRERQAKSK